ncbi:hypothetical protein [Aneurinibacillus sp. REN35]
MGMIYLAFGTAGAILLIIIVGLIIGFILSRKDKKKQRPEQ